MSDWIHCNKCFLKYNAQTTFFLAECSHIFCHRCVENIKISKLCLICKKQGNVLPLKDVEKSVLDFFLPYESLLKKLIEVHKFQTQHRNALYVALLNKYNYIKKEYIKCYKSNKALMRENQELRSMLRSAGKNPRFITSTPISLSSSSNITVVNPNGSMMSSIPPHRPAFARDNSAITMRTEFPRRNQMLSGGSSQRSSSIQRVPRMMTPLDERRSFIPGLDRLTRGSKS